MGVHQRKLCTMSSEYWWSRFSEDRAIGQSFCKRNTKSTYVVMLTDISSILKLLGCCVNPIIPNIERLKGGCWLYI